MMTTATETTEYDRVCQTCGAAIYQGVMCAACWSARAFPPKNPNAPAEADVGNEVP